MIGWLRRVFSHRPADPDLGRSASLHAARVARVEAVAGRADEVADKVVTETRREAMRASFARADGRLAGR